MRCNMMSFGNKLGQRVKQHLPIVSSTAECFLLVLAEGIFHANHKFKQENVMRVVELMTTKLFTVDPHDLIDRVIFLGYVTVSC